MNKTFTLDEVCEAIAIATDIGLPYIKQEYVENSLHDGSTAVEALAYVICKSIPWAGCIHFEEEPEIVE